MLAAISIPTLLLLASVAVAQDDTPTVATSPFVSPTPESEALYTIQTQTATDDVDPWSCYMECVQPPCPACTGSMMSVPPVSMPSVTDVSVIPPVSMPTVTDVSIPPQSGISVVTTPVPMPTVTDVSIPPQDSTGAMSIPEGETPISSGAVDTPSSSLGSAASATSSGLPEQTENAAAARGRDMPVVVAIAGALAFL
ncbi:hypothetical protein J4E86_004199 [Alternaria arbusti]|uniref:uncharacterized protein n=1 Tax=Alternaria arbusti TaxID=232088 RepID=UPI002220F04A|nr:uncharacterized protein J4E86_004199 [Alternaria arbusti]KAI4958595.1 hypothetical protein J4E86_004199 [Alternaria arbusti]